MACLHNIGYEILANPHLRFGATKYPRADFALRHTCMAIPQYSQILSFLSQNTIDTIVINQSCDVLENRQTTSTQQLNTSVPQSENNDNIDLHVSRPPNTICPPSTPPNVNLHTEFTLGTPLFDLTRMDAITLVQISPSATHLHFTIRAPHGSAPPSETAILLPTPLALSSWRLIDGDTRRSIILAHQAALTDYVRTRPSPAPFFAATKSFKSLKRGLDDGELPSLETRRHVNTTVIRKLYVHRPASRLATHVARVRADYSLHDLNTIRRPTNNSYRSTALRNAIQSGHLPPYLSKTNNPGCPICHRPDIYKT